MPLDIKGLYFQYQRIDIDAVRQDIYGYKDRYCRHPAAASAGTSMERNVAPAAHGLTPWSELGVG